MNYQAKNKSNRPATNKKSWSRSRMIAVLGFALLLMVFVWLINDLRFILYSSKLSWHGWQLKQLIPQYGQQLLTPTEQTPQVVGQLRQNLQQADQHSQQLAQIYPQTKLVKKFCKAEQFYLITELIKDANQLAQYFLTGQHSWLALLQNTHELRATGGFMGSYARLELDNGQLTKLEIQDIYEPDGQFTGYVEAPPGVKEYLSSGQGLRLPDANWQADFPTSAQTILSFFAHGKEQRLEGVVAVNLSLMQKLLQLTGPVYLADYDTWVNADNLAQVARADRQEFFPGSRAKRNFLTSLTTQLKINLTQLELKDQQSLLDLLAKALKQKELQFYTNVPEIEKVFQKNQVAGVLGPKQPSDFYLYLLESNVGINKANQAITRQVKLRRAQSTITIEVKFSNNNQSVVTTSSPSLPIPTQALAQADHLGYVNYQRLILPTNAVINSISYDADIQDNVNLQLINSWDEKLITNFTNQEFKQLGFLITLAAQHQGLLTIKLNLDKPLPQPAQVWLQKQPGLPAVQYQLEKTGQTTTILLDQDQLIEW
ncbi:MAG: DUF4012 domain-containing protein [Candidatus Pacebacteria bacterium]|nr:DUF4012 domain-containing protein [Candidatus Paceibacterota bacterium]